MGRASTYSDAAELPQTCCTTCRTVFEVSPELLSSSDTRVRCGECLSIFDALANLRDPGDETAAIGVEPAAADDAEDTASVAESIASVSPARETGDRSGDDAPGDGGGADAHGVADEAEVAALARLADETGSLDVTYADFDLFSGDAQLPEIAYLDETAETAEFDFDSVDVDEDETFSDTLFAHDVTVEPGALGETSADGTAAGDDEDARDASSADAEPDPDFIEDEEPVEPLVFAYRDAAVSRASAGGAADVVAGADASVSARADGHDADALASAEPSPPADAAALAAGAAAADGPPVRSGGSWLFGTVLALALFVLLAGLYAYRERDTLHNDPLARPLLLAVCKVTGCTVPSRVELASLRLLDKKVFTHPREPSALVINVAFRNAATFEQRYPVLVVRLRDRLGRVVAERDFAPADYLDAWAPGDTLGAGRRLDISLEVGDPGDGAESYEFEFREAAA